MRKAVADPMKVMDVLSPQRVRAPLAATEKRGVIDELVDLLAEHEAVSDPTALKDAVWAREQIRTTGIGHGTAVPHGKGASVDRVLMAVGKPSEPLDFEAIDGQPVRLVFLLASPPDRTKEHIQALSRVSKLMVDAEFREKIYAAETGEQIYELLRAQDDLV